MTAVSGSWWSGPYDHRGIAVADSRDGSPNGFHICRSMDKTARPGFSRPTSPIRGKCGLCWTASSTPIVRSFIMKSVWVSGSARHCPRNGLFATSLVVNFFDGGPRTSVEYWIGQRAPVKMERVVRPDPFVEEVFAHNEATKKPWVRAEPSSHIWSARLPSDLEAGTHCARVRVIDEYGREYRDHLVVELTASGGTAKARGG
jgi:hypothetical protein